MAPGCRSHVRHADFVFFAVVAELTPKAGCLDSSRTCATLCSEQKISSSNNGKLQRTSQQDSSNPKSQWVGWSSGGFVWYRLRWCSCLQRCLLRSDGCELKRTILFKSQSSSFVYFRCLQLRVVIAQSCSIASVVWVIRFTPKVCISSCHGFSGQSSSIAAPNRKSSPRPPAPRVRCFFSIQTAFLIELHCS